MTVGSSSDHDDVAQDEKVAINNSNDGKTDQLDCSWEEKRDQAQFGSSLGRLTLKERNSDLRI